MMKIIPGGMGNFLNPPGDAEHLFSVQEGSGRNAGYMSLRHALTCPYVPNYLKEQIGQLLAEHQPQCTEEWEREVYAYFNGCYSPDGKDRSVSKLVIAKQSEYTPPMFNPHWHLGYMLIREFFPDREPRLDLIENPPKWGK